MLNQALKSIIVDHLLPDAQTPAQYVGGEWNATVKDHRSLRGTLCLAFPDAYSIGMSHHGLQVLYDLMNRRDDWACERAFTPLGDMEQMLRERKLPLWSLETFTPLARVRRARLHAAIRSVLQQRADDARSGRDSALGRRSHDGASAGDRRRAVRGQSRADVAVHRPVRHRRRRRDVAGGVRSVAATEAIGRRGLSQFSCQRKWDCPL